MTEAEWLACSDPDEMLCHLEDRPEPRRARLFHAACARRVLPLLGPRRQKMAALLARALEVAERFADGEADEQQRRDALQAVRKAAAALPVSGLDGMAVTVVRQALDPLALQLYSGDTSATLARTAAGLAAGGEAAEAAAQAGLLRCLFGNPFCPVAFDPALRLWNGGAAVALAREMYEGRDFGKAPLLADMLEDAGCTDPLILNHLRGPGPHARGCFAIDLLLGKA